VLWKNPIRKETGALPSNSEVHVAVITSTGVMSKKTPSNSPGMARETVLRMTTHVGLDPPTLRLGIGDMPNFKHVGTCRSTLMGWHGRTCCFSTCTWAQVSKPCRRSMGELDVHHARGHRCLAPQGFARETRCCYCTWAQVFRTSRPGVEDDAGVHARKHRSLH
jgi:hypothetical protein